MPAPQKGKIAALCLYAAVSLLLIQIPVLQQFSPLFFIIAGMLMSLAMYQSYQQTKEKKRS